MRSLPLEASPFVQGVKEKLKALPLKQVQQKGIWRKRDGYYLNISYPSMQAMEPIKAGQVFTKVDKREGKDVALYIHVPFCTAECYYCHYYKEFGKSSQQVDTYISSVLKELRLYQEHFAGIRAKSIYIGGGTPSYMSSEQIDRLFTAIEQYVTIPKGIEISFEVHPESGTEDKLAVLAMHKVNRINVGVESFDNRLLTSEHRRHTAEQAEEIYQRIKSRFPIVNLDFIYGLKGQTVAYGRKLLIGLPRYYLLLPLCTFFV